MKVSLAVLCRPEVAAGFALAGIPTVEARSPAAAASRLGALADDGMTGVVLTEESFHAALPDELRRLLARRPLPMVVPFPGVEREGAPGTAESYIVELLRQVIGYRVRLK